jgi:putative oxidoreductase
MIPKTWMTAADIAARACVGGLFVYSGVSKLAGPEAFADAIHAFHILPTALINPTALSLPFFELLAGVCLLIGWRLREMALATAIMVVAFTAVLVQARLRGFDLDCGCFGSNAWPVLKAVPPLARNAVLLVATIFLRWRHVAVWFR